MKQDRSNRPWAKMSAGELARATRAFDDPSFLPPVVAEPAGLAARHRKALAMLRSKAKPASSGDSAQVRITLKRALLRGADKLAQDKGITRSEVIARGLELLLVQ
jgi:hypothetical protein